MAECNNKRAAGTMLIYEALRDLKAGKMPTATYLRYLLEQLDDALWDDARSKGALLSYSEWLSKQRLT